MFKGVLYNIGIQPIFYTNFKWKLTFKNCIKKKILRVDIDSPMKGLINMNYMFKKKIKWTKDMRHFFKGHATYK